MKKILISHRAAEINFDVFDIENIRYYANYQSMKVLLLDLAICENLGYQPQVRFFPKSLSDIQEIFDNLITDFQENDLKYFSQAIAEYLFDDRGRKILCESEIIYELEPNKPKFGVKTYFQSVLNYVGNNWRSYWTEEEAKEAFRNWD